MTTQLRLIDSADADWRLDERTREIGRRGLARARQALRTAKAPTVPADRHPSAA